MPEDERSEETTEIIEIRIQRILVALDASTHSLAALDAAARLAAAMEAQLIGLFVEDINLLRLAALPFAKEVSWPSTAGRELSEAKMERDLKLRASQARRALAYAAEQVEAEWSFSVVRGSVSQEVISAAMEADLLSLGRASRSLTRRVRLGSTAQAAAASGIRSVFLAQQGADLHEPFVVTYDGSPGAARAVSAAAKMAEANETNLIVLIMADEPDEAPKLAEEVSERLEEYIAHVDYRYLPPDNGKNLIEALQREKCGLVILGGDSPLLQGSALQGLLNDLDCPVMLIR